ncbi:polygalacturonase ADPG2 [Selaginella moellendorffii]|uniref:polygalacturonase ADPG2 n=1 Tax=Selaginella moellendorffii TaxID=88036 RepID=UPI000D1C4F4D|nr:polygalacturonase ADPG2 [Selaginella moellendorffii]|eukprot:XP_024540454.1 polygalacturonase ADPG2 [Selaginella moellendorffii]
MVALTELLLVAVMIARGVADLSELSPALSPEGASYDPREFNVVEFGARGDGLSDDSQAFLAAWKRACHTENATMLVPGGKAFVVNYLLLTGPCATNLRLKIDGIVLADTRDMIHWSNITTWISIARVYDFSVEGYGIIDGQGEEWWRISCRRNSSYACQKHPTAKFLILTLAWRLTQTKPFYRHCQSELRRTSQFRISIEESSNVSIKGVEILAPHDSPNTDGIHLHMSNNVSIEKCIIGTGDDCISIAKNTSNVVIREIICGPGHGISIGSLGRNKTPEFVSNVKVENSILESTKYGLRIKTWQGGQGFASNFSYYNVVMMNVLQPIIIDQYYCDGNSSFSCGTEELDAVKVSNVSYSNIMGTSASSVALRFQCSLGNPCYNLVLENVFLNLSNGSTPSAFCLNAFGQNKGLVVPNSCLNSSLAWQQ